MRDDVSTEIMIRGPVERGSTTKKMQPVMYCRSSVVAPTDDRADQDLRNVPPTAERAAPLATSAPAKPAHLSNRERWTRKDSLAAMMFLVLVLILWRQRTIAKSA